MLTKLRHKSPSRNFVAALTNPRATGSNSFKSDNSKISIGNTLLSIGASLIMNGAVFLLDFHAIIAVAVVIFSTQNFFNTRLRDLFVSKTKKNNLQFLKLAD
jgi:hypothetical protein